MVLFRVYAKWRKYSLLWSTCVCVCVCYMSHCTNLVRTIALLWALPLHVVLCLASILNSYSCWTSNRYFRLSWSILLYYLDCVPILRACVCVFELVGFVSFISFYCFHIIWCAYCRLSGSSTKAAFVARMFAIVFWAVFEYIDAFTLLFHLFSSPLLPPPSSPLSQSRQSSAIVRKVLRCKSRIATAKYFTLVVVFIFYSLCRMQKKKPLNHFPPRLRHSFLSCFLSSIIILSVNVQMFRHSSDQIVAGISDSGSKRTNRKKKKQEKNDKWNRKSRLMCGMSVCAFDSARICHKCLDVPKPIFSSIESLHR